jgi:exopolysaccharide biosynthesis polyprenyl glycosylphosphotransferase
MFSRRSRILGVACVLGDSLPTVLAFLLAYGIRVWIGRAGFVPNVNIYPVRVYLPLLLASLLVFPSLGYVLGAYQDLENRSLRTIASDVLKMSSSGFLVLLTGLFLVQGHYISRSLLLIFAVLHFVLLGAGRWLFFVGNAQLRRKAEHHRNFIIVGTGGGAAALASLLEEGEKFGLRLLAFVSIVGGEASPPGLRSSYSVLPLERLPELLHNHVVDEVVFATEKIEEMVKLEPLMRQCEQEGVRMRIQLDFLPSGFPHVYVEHLAHIPLLTFAGSPPFEEALLVKRAMDFVLASLALIVLSPLFVILAALVALTSPGPVFYRQTRCGLGGRRFSLLKFRSMVDNAEDSRFGLEKLNEVDGPVFKMRDDPRCTRVGRWMRMFSLDELPQLWNVVCGDMSLVGPRPPLPQEVEQYEPWQRRRLRMRPGLTCLWALEGRSQLRFDRWVKLDLLYIDRWSIWLDCKILFKTIPAVLSGKGAH